VRGGKATNDEEICRQLVEDLDVGFATLVEAYGRTAFSIAARTAPEPEDAEDLAAEAFLRAYRALRRYDATRIRLLRVRPWLVTIVLNVSRNARREATRRPQQGRLRATDEPVFQGREASELVEVAAEAGELAARLLALPAKQRVAVVLRHVVNLPLSEIAAVLGCAEGTARSHVARGLAALRAAYGATTGEGPPAAGERRSAR
jgi:RNA polymerase sigma-70 factor (ECF subfamily)